MKFSRIFSKTAIIAWVISICIVSWLSLAPRVEFPLNFIFSDKIFHSLAYLWLAVLPAFGFKQNRAAITASLSMILMGIGLEILQAFIPGRFSSVVDIIANCIGVFTGIFMGRHIKQHLLK